MVSTYEELLKNGERNMRFKLLEEVNKEDILDVAQKWFKENNPSTGWSERGFILRDGYITANPETFSQYANRVAHSQPDLELQRYLYNNSYIDEIDIDSMLTDKLGFIRVNGDNEDYICITKVRPTQEQYQALRDWLKEYFKRKDSLEVTEWESGQQASYKYPEYGVEDIINKIKKYYTTGELTENLEESHREETSLRNIQKWLQNWLNKKLSVEESMKVNKLNSIESTRSQQNVARLTEKFDEYSFTTYEDVLSGDIGNMSEEQLDQELKFFKRKAKALGLIRPEDLVIYIDEEDEFAPDWEYREEKVVDKNSKLYDADGIKVIYEIINGRSFLYFNSKENAKEYFSKFEQ